MSKVEELKSKIEKKDVSGKDIMLFLEAIQEISQDSEDIQDLLEDMKEEEEVIHLNLILTDLNNLTASLSIVDGGNKHRKRKKRTEPWISSRSRKLP